MTIRTLAQIAHDPYWHFVALLMLVTLALLALDAYWIVTGSVLPIPRSSNDYGDRWIVRAWNPSQYWFAVGWYVLGTAGAAVTTTVVFRLVHRLDPPASNNRHTSRADKSHDGPTDYP